PSGSTSINSPDWTELGFFKTDTTGNWQRKAFTAPSSCSAARFAIRHYLSSGGPSGLASEYVGIDQITVSTGVVGREEELANSKISIYPNPAKQEITVATATGEGIIQ